MRRIFAVWRAAAVMLSLGGLAEAARAGAVVPPGDALRLKVSADGRYFVDQNGSPVFWLGTTQWQLTLMLFCASRATRTW
jgi:hypothetical protein